MKTLLVLALVIFSFTANATIYYISSSGNDSNNGTSTNAPWRTLDKVNSKIFSPGDNILFNRGDLFYGTLTINQSGTSGNPITFGAYGVGNNPVITGFTSVTNWINLGGNIWESESAVSTLSTCNILLINGMNTPMGRYPNNGWLTYQSSTSSSLNSSSLNGATTNWSGAEAVIKKERWIIDRNVITTASGTTINYVPGAYSGHAGWGFFIQNDARTLDTQNEWYYNPSTKKIRIYSNLQPSGIQLSTLANVLYGVNKNYIRIDSMSFTGANTDAFYLGNVGNWTIQNCTFDFNYNGIKGYQYGGSSSNLLISNCLVNHSNNNAISLSPEFAGAIISNNVIKNSGLLLGMSGSGDGQAEALNVTGSNYLIQYNEVDSCGYVGIGFNGGGVQCKNNYVNYFCSIKDDGGGIYTGNPQNGVVISNNIINNGIGADDGTGFTNNGKASGIYMDDNASGMRVLNNSISNIIYAGIFIHNGNNIEVRENTTYNCAIGFLVDNDTQNSFTTSIISKKNIFCANTTGTQFSPQEQKCISFKTAHTSGSDIARFGNVDSNYYARPIQTNGSIWASVYGVADSYYNLSQWQSAYGFDINSAVSPKTITDLNDLRFVYNSTNFSRTISLDANYIDVTSKVYNGIITLAPYTSAVLVRNGNLIKNQPPTATAGSSQTITLPTNIVTLNGSGNDSDGTISSYQWTKVLGPSSYTISNASSATTSVKGLIAGIYVFKLTVTDDKGATAADSVTITVNPAANIPPTA
ncbi:MAG: PKD domain-containing protein, partial [Ginsengibacter sp.]